MKWDVIVCSMLTTCVLAGVVFSAVKVADQIQKEITAKRSEVDNLRSKVRRLEEKMETVTKVGVTSLVSIVFGTVTSLVSFVFRTVTSLMSFVLGTVTSLVSFVLGTVTSLVSFVLGLSLIHI